MPRRAQPSEFGPCGLWGLFSLCGCSSSSPFAVLLPSRCPLGLAPEKSTQAFNPRPWDPRVESEPKKSVNSLEFEVGPRALGRIQPGAGGTGTNSDWCPRCLQSSLGARFGHGVEPGSWIPSWNQAWELDSDLKESLGPVVEAPIDLWK